MDEPTGSLDRKNADRVMDLIEEFRNETDIAILAITHDPAVAARAEERFRLVDGKMEREVS